MVNFLVKLERRFSGWFGRSVADIADPYLMVRNALVVTPELQPALDAFDQRDLVAALEITEQLAKDGVPAAQHNLGIFYETGSGLLSGDDAKAEHWYRKAAQQGLSEAQYQLASILAGDAMIAGTEYDDAKKQFVEAYMWLLFAQADGHKEAPHALRRLAKHMNSEQLAEAKKQAGI